MILQRRWKFLPNLLLPTLGPMNSNGKTCCKNTNTIRTNYLTLRSYPNYAPTLVWKLSKDDNISSHLMQKDRVESYICAENIRCLVTIWDLEQEAGFVGIRETAQSLNIHDCHHEDRYGFEIQVRFLFQDRTASWVRIVNGVEKIRNRDDRTI